MHPIGASIIARPKSSPSRRSTSSTSSRVNTTAATTIPTSLSPAPIAISSKVQTSPRSTPTHKNRTPFSPENRRLGCPFPAQRIRHRRSDSDRSHHRSPSRIERSSTRAATGLASTIGKVAICRTRTEFIPNHFHLLLTPKPEHALSEIMRSLKRHTALEINKHLGREGSIWQQESFTHIVRSGE